MTDLNEHKDRILALIDGLSGSTSIGNLALEARALKQLLDPPPVDPDLLAVRKIMADHYDECHNPMVAAQYRAGHNDDLLSSQLKSFKAGRELQKSEPSEAVELLTRSLNALPDCYASLRYAIDAFLNKQQDART